MTDRITPAHGRDEDRGRITETAASDRFNALPASTRRLLQDLRDDDVDQIQALIKVISEEHAIDRLKSALEMARTFSNFGKYTKWMFFAVASTFISVAGIISALEKIGPFLHRGAKP